MPKGVAITHHNVTQLMESLDGRLAAGGRCGRSVIRWPSTCRCGRSSGALLHGGRLVVVPEAVAGSPEDFHDVLVAEQVSVSDPDPVGGGDALAAGFGVGGVGGRR